MQWDSLTHIQYSFAMVDQATNKIKLGDKHAALEEEFKNHNLSYKGKKVELDPNLPYKGHFNLLQTMKKQYPDVNLLISVGGWAGSRGFYTMLDTDEGINTFADSCVDFIKKYNLMVLILTLNIHLQQVSQEIQRILTYLNLEGLN